MLETSSVAAAPFAMPQGSVQPGTMPRGPVPPFTMVVRDALRDSRNAAFAADLLFLEAWEMFPTMHTGSVLRVNQIRRANPALAAALDQELKAARQRMWSNRAA